MNHKKINADSILPQLRRHYWELVKEHNHVTGFMEKYELIHTKKLVADIKKRMKRIKESEDFISKVAKVGFVIVDENGAIKNREDAFNTNLLHSEAECAEQE